MEQSLKSSDQRGDAQTDTVQSPFHPQLFPKALGPLPLIEMVWSLNSFAARLRRVAKKQSWPDGVGAAWTPISQLGGGSKHSLAAPLL